MASTTSNMEPGNNLLEDDILTAPNVTDSTIQSRHPGLANAPVKNSGNVSNLVRMRFSDTPSTSANQSHQNTISNTNNEKFLHANVHTSTIMRRKRLLQNPNEDEYGVPQSSGNEGFYSTHSQGVHTPSAAMTYKQIRNNRAMLSKRPCVTHSSGAMFELPISLEAYPTPLGENTPENAKSDILKEDEGLPYCTTCNVVLKTWHGYEYHVMKEHVKYRPYRCYYCVKDYFFTEEECEGHLRSQHPNKTVQIVKEVNDAKELECNEHFDTLFSMVRVTQQRPLTSDVKQAIEDAQIRQLQRFKNFRFKVPVIVTRQNPSVDRVTQTYVTMSSPQTMMASSQSMMGNTKYPYMMPSRPVCSEQNVKLVRLITGEFAQVVHDPTNPDRYMDGEHSPEYNIDVDGDIEQHQQRYR